MLITNLPLKQKNQSPETILFYKVSTIHWISIWRWCNWAEYKLTLW
jgi:hypothetical protein